jgi:hypothetical protein
MDVKLIRRIGHLVRWGLELLFLFVLVEPEVGPWTLVLFTLLTVGIEFDHLKPEDWSKL